jgi:para-nitrobenzyl esterase
VLARIGAKASDLEGFAADRLLAGLATNDPSIVGGRVYWGPVLDDVSLPVHPFWPEAPAQSASIPMVMGNTREETGLLIGGSDPSLKSLTWESLPKRLERDMVTDIEVANVIQTYRSLYPDITPTQLFFRATTAGRSWRGQVIEAEARARQGAPTWVYQLNWASPREGGVFGAYHTLDIPLVFGNLSSTPDSDTGAGPEAHTVSTAMRDALLRFARTGDPSGGALGAWAMHSLRNRETMLFDKEPRMEDDPRKVEREMFGKAPYIQPGAY